MKVSELTGTLLAYWVARAQGYQDVRIGSGVVRYSIGTISYDFYLSWDVCGPIIERERYSFATVGTGAPDENGNEPVVCIGRNTKAMEGPTHLIAAMRCFIASRYGEEVPDE